ncbi:ornithine carbamoyltransferase [uncultured Anaerococcus sp.]|uniref:ornithine carbamoyltransferase n=1 Tax=uncultured Anaerococcus sp. TaxID=293428 RepID=UPI002617011D|nr:ornithine carbamoyltransferase [uncultured Anaerococcus sp.]
MEIDLRNRNFLDMKYFKEEEILYLIDLAEDFKKLKREKKAHKYLEGQNLILLFEEASTRTRTSFEVAAFDLGMGVSLINSNSSKLGEKESIEDSINVFDRYFDGIVYRGNKQAMLEKLVKMTEVPIYNAMTDKSHPSQMISDMLTIKEKFGYLRGLNLVYLGYPGDIMPNSLAVTCAKLGINFTACGPREYFPQKDFIDLSQDFAENHHSEVIYTEDLQEAVRGADIIYTDMWIALNEMEKVPVDRIYKLYPYRVDSKVMAKTHDNSIFMHCLPAFHDKKSKLAQKVIAQLPKDMDFNGMEVTDEVFRSQKSMVFDQTENRIPAVKAILYSTLKVD